jgi:cystathionine beta-lyase/cystathionine gamma-synthase
MSNAIRAYGCRADHGPRSGPMSPPLVRATAFAYPDADTLRAVGAGELAGEFYPRYGHQAGRAFESRIATLEQADGAVSFASGMAAAHAMFFGLLRSGDVLAVSRQVYGGVEAIVAEDLPRFGVEVRRFDAFNADAIASLPSLRPRLVHVETPTNPLARVVDLDRIIAAAHQCGALVSVDATFLPPPFQRPLARGADLVMHSATKMLGGHSDVMAGVVSGRHELLERLERFRRRAGGVLPPDSAWLLLRSLSTLELRCHAAADNAMRLAQMLEAERARGGAVARVHYPGLPSHPDHAVALGAMSNFGYMLAFEVSGGLPAAIRVYDHLRVIARAVSLGGTETLASIPVHTSHEMMSPAERAAAGIEDGLIRLSVGIEPYDTLAGDLRSALAAAG